MRKAEIYLWLYLIKHGFVAREWSYYGGYYITAKSDTRKMLKDIKENGINWDKTERCYDDTETSFAGTFNDPVETPVITGTLVTNSGKTYTLRLDKDVNYSVSIIDVILEMIEISQGDINDVLLKIVEQRLNN